MTKTKIKLDMMGLLLPAALISLWIFLPFFHDIPSYRLPSFKRVTAVALDFIFGNYHLTSYSGSLLSHVLVSLRRIVSGFLVASVFGVSLGLLSGYSRLFSRIISPLIHFFRMIPGIGWLPIALLWFGTGDKTTLFLISLAAFFPYLSIQCYL